MQLFTAFNFSIDNDQKALFPTAKGRFRLYISATYHPNVFVSVSFGYWHLSVCYLYVVVYYPYVSVRYPYVVLVCTSMYLCVTRLLPRVIPLCICVVFLVKILVNGYGHSEEIAVIVHNNPFTFLYKEEENRAGHLFAKRKVGISIAN